MKPYKLLLALIVVAFNLSSSIVIGQTEFSLKDLLEIAEAESPVLKMAAIDIESADGILQQSRSAFKPSLGLSLSYKYWDQERTGNTGVPSGSKQFYSDQLTNSTLQVRQLLLESGKFESRFKAAAENKASFEFRFERVKQELFFEILGFGITSINQTAKIEAFEKNLKDIEEALKNIKKMKEVGKVAQVAVLRMEFRRQEALAVLDEAFHQQKILLTKIARLAGLKEVPDKIHNEKLDISINSVKNEFKDKWVDKALKQRPDYLAEEKRLKATDFELRALRNELKPSLNFIASLNKNGDQTGWGFYNGFAGVEISWPLADGGAAKGKAKSAEAKKDKAYYNLEQLKLKIVEEIRTAISRVLTSQSKIERSQKGLALAEETYRIEKLTYENGKNTINDLLDAQSEVFSARARLIQDNNELIVAQLSFNLAIGNLDY